MNYYPDTKKHISPSALSQWHQSKSSFIRSYFAGEKTPETEAMKFGKKIHALIEGGFLKVNQHYASNEQTLSVPIKDGVQVLGVPDSFQGFGDFAEFVDYKTGKENTWTNEMLASDLKMKCTAWLVWVATGHPDQVTGHIEHIQTKWNEETREYELVDERAVLAAVYVYRAQELEAFTEIIAKTITEVNEEYPKWLKSSKEFVNTEDCAAYALLEAQKKEIEERQKEIKERIDGQMSFGGVKNFESDYGTFYVIERKTYDHPLSLKAQLDNGQTFTLAESEAIDKAIGVAKKEWELTAEPKSVSRSLGFRAKK